VIILKKSSLSWFWQFSIQIVSALIKEDFISPVFAGDKKNNLDPDR
jgi:hypothetical protein